MRHEAFRGTLGVFLYVTILVHVETLKWLQNASYLSKQKNMITKDLFGNVYVEETPTREQKYQDYLNSAQWKRIRDAKIKSVGNKCERCGRSKWTSPLTVHHKTYAHFQNERMEELEVVCRKCHLQADTERVQVLENKKGGKAIFVGFENWMDNGNNEGWRNENNDELSYHWESFLAYLEHNTGRNFDIPFWRNPEW